MDRMDNVQAIVPLTAAQKGLLYQTLAAGTDALYRTQSRDTISGPFDSALFRSAIQYLINRHESLRCLFLYAGLDEPAAVVQQHSELPWHEHDLTGLEDELQQSRLREIAEASFQEPLALDTAPLMRVTVVKLSDELSQIIFDIHHLIFDGWSSVVFFSELQIVYSSLQSGQPVQLPVTGKFSDYAKRINASDVDQTRSYWSEKLKGFESPTSLQLDKAVADDDANGQFTNASFRVSLDAQVSRKLNEIARTARVTMSTMTEAAWALTLARYNNTSDVVIGVTLNGRSSSLQEHALTFGMFVNALPLRLQCHSRDKVFDWLQKVQAEKGNLNRYENASVADIHLASELPAGIGLFDALLVFQTFPKINPMDDPPLRFSNAGIHENNPLPLVIDIFDGQELAFLVMYNDQRLPGNSAAQLMGHYLQILSSMAALRSPGSASLKDLSMLTDADTQRLLHDWKTPAVSASVTVPDTLHSVFLRQALASPYRVAVSDSTGSTSYAELAEAAGQVCSYLEQNGIGQGDVVAVCLERSVQMYPAILGVMMAGALFLPVDPANPARRTEYMLSDSNARLVFIAGTLQPQFDTAKYRTVHLENDWQAIADAVSQNRHSHESSGTPVDAAYIMYTSGSTGLAKGVVGSHQATLNRLRWMWHAYPFNDADVCCQKTSLSFVDSIGELMGPLLAGVPTVVLTEETVKHAHRLVDEIQQAGISRIVLLPSLLSVLLDSVNDIASRLSSLTLCVVSGEPLRRNIAEQFLAEMPHCLLLNLYGSTEVSADVTSMEVRSDVLNEVVSATMPIGRPISNCQVYIVNSARELMPPGAIGEIAVAGKGLSLGYAGSHAALNQEKFPGNPFGDGQLYLTGDLGRFRTDGVLEHCGRSDAQIKIRGFRIEPAEVEQVIAAFDGIRTSLVHASGNDTLHAYYRVKREHTVDNAALQDFVRQHLPDYMVPVAMVELDDFPRLPNGKINRKALPDPTVQTKAQRTAPRTETEKQIAAIWQQVLGGESPSVFDNFVDVGGSSLTGMRFNAHIYRDFGKMVLPRMLLTGSLAQIAAHIRPEDTVGADSEQLDIDLIQPLFFGQSPQRLFGVLHKPVANERRRAVLLVPSIGHEYMRLQRSYQLLATELAKAGFHVLRFDLYGFGDSEGEPADATFEQWQNNVASAVDFLLSSCDAESVTSVGVRLGAPIMLGAGVKEIDQYVLWDPVCAGKPYLQHLDALHRYAMGNLDRYRFRQHKSHPWERFGYTYSESLARQIAEVDIRTLAGFDADNILVITTGDVIRHNDMDIALLLSMEGIGHEHVDSINLWTGFDQASYLAFAQPVVRRIAARIAGA